MQSAIQVILMFNPFLFDFSKANINTSLKSGLVTYMYIDTLLHNIAESSWFCGRGTCFKLIRLI